MSVEKKMDRRLWIDYVRGNVEAGTAERMEALLLGDEAAFAAYGEACHPSNRSCRNLWTSVRLCEACSRRCRKRSRGTWISKPNAGAGILCFII